VVVLGFLAGADAFGAGAATGAGGAAVGVRETDGDGVGVSEAVALADGEDTLGGVSAARRERPPPPLVTANVVTLAAARIPAVMLLPMPTVRLVSLMYHCFLFSERHFHRAQRDIPPSFMGMVVPKSDGPGADARGLQTAKQNPDYASRLGDHR
jgi:hypothetical protein